MNIESVKETCWMKHLISLFNLCKWVYQYQTFMSTSSFFFLKLIKQWKHRHINLSLGRFKHMEASWKQHHEYVYNMIRTPIHYSLGSCLLNKMWHFCFLKSTRNKPQRLAQSEPASSLTSKHGSLWETTNMCLLQDSHPYPLFKSTLLAEFVLSKMVCFFKSQRLVQFQAAIILTSV